MIEVKADALEASFEEFRVARSGGSGDPKLEREDDDVAALREEVAALKARVEAEALAEARPALSGVKAATASPFVERYLRKGLEAGLELKALSGASDAAGGYAVPEEIDAAIARTFAAISPIRAIANVVKVGSSGYRKLVTEAPLKETMAAAIVLLSRWSAERPFVDPFCGSGTTLDVAKETERNARGFDLAPSRPDIPVFAAVSSSVARRA